MRNSNTQLVAQLLDVEQATLRSNVGLAQVLNAVDNGCADCPGNSIVIRFSYATKCSDVCLQ
jgi:hypothetical protein